MPSVYNYRHVELDKVGRGKRAIQPPGGQTADIFGRNAYENSFSSASSQAGSDVGSSSRVHIDTDQQSISSSSMISAATAAGPVDGVVKQPAGDGQMSPTSSVGSSSLASSPSQQQQQQQLLMSTGEMSLLQQQAAAEAATRTPKKTIPVLRRNPITGEILGSPSGGVQPAVVRVRQPPGGRSSGIF